MTQLSKQQSFLSRSSTKSKTATIASFKIAEILLKHKKPFENGEIWKESYIKAREFLYQNFKNKSEIIVGKSVVMEATGTHGQTIDLIRSIIKSPNFLLRYTGRA